MAPELKRFTRSAPRKQGDSGPLQTGRSKMPGSLLDSCLPWHGNSFSSVCPTKTATLQ